MVAPARGSLVLVPFPFSDLSQSRLRPAVVLAQAGRGDWILCQITSKTYGDPKAVGINQEDFDEGGLRLDGFARPGKLFTAHETLLRAEAGRLRAAAFDRIRAALVSLLS